MKIYLLPALLCLFMASSCSDSKDDNSELRLGTAEVDCHFTSRQLIGILGGSGDYSVKVADETVATAEISGPLSENGYAKNVKIQCLKPGETTVTVTDLTSGQTQPIKLSVYEWGMLLQQIDVTAYTGNSSADQQAVTGAARAQSPFTPFDRYILTGPGKNTMYMFEDIVLKAKQTFTQTATDGEVILTFSDTDGDARTLKLDDDPTLKGTRYYLEFFGFSPETGESRANMVINHIAFREEVTDRLSADFPGAGTITARYILSMQSARLYGNLEN